MPRVSAGINFSDLPTTFNHNEGTIAGGNSSSKYTLLLYACALCPDSTLGVQGGCIQQISEDVSRSPKTMMFLGNFGILPHG